jgi:excinuclease ABC subunit A
MCQCMLKSSASAAIRLHGVRHNNLKNFDLDLPLNRLIVITGLSGSGKSSLAFDTLFAEGQRRYIETFSPYARQFLDRMDKPQVDSIEGIPPAIAIEQRNAVKSTRSTVGTMTELCDYMKLLWPQVAQLHCRQCGQPVRKDSPQTIFELMTPDEGAERLITFDLPLTEKLSLEECLALVAKQGYQRLLVAGQVRRLDELPPRTKTSGSVLTVVQDRLRPTPANRARFVEACEQAYHFGKGKLTAWEIDANGVVCNPRPFSAGFHCAQCDIEYREPSPALFSFNHPVGACPACRGFGRIISIDYNLALPDRSKTLAEGVVKPWQTGTGAECQSDLRRMCRHFGVPMDVPFEKLAKKWQDLVINGDPDYGKDEEHHWPRTWYGVKGYFRWLESKAYKMHVRVLLSRYRAYTPCPDCRGQRFQPESLLYRVGVSPGINKLSHAEGSPSPTLEERRLIKPTNPEALTLANFYQLPIRDALRFVEELSTLKRFRANDPLALVLSEVRARLGYLDQVGLGYLTLDRPTRSLSGGETERVNLTTCLGTRLVNTLFVLDEPSVGLHPRDTERLVPILEQLRNAGNTVVVVEHEASVMRAADQIIDLGPGHGATGGQVIFQGSYRQILNSPASLTGQYLAGRKQIPISQRRGVDIRPLALTSQGKYPEPRRLEEQAMLNDAPAGLRSRIQPFPTLSLAHATQHNLRDFAVEIPLGRFVCVTGVSGSGKTTLVRDVLLPALASRLRSETAGLKASEWLRNMGDQDENDLPAESANPVTLTGSEHLSRVVLVDQSILAKTPRSNPAVYIGAFDDMREVFAQSDLAKQRGLNASAFSFNSGQGQCERCRGAGFEKIEMQFLSDVFIRCPDCNGRRYRPHILEIKLVPAGRNAPDIREKNPSNRRKGRWNSEGTLKSASIADLLEATVDEAIEFLSAFAESRPAQRAAASLRLLQEVGLGYLKLGQPLNTLSGGEGQRLKLVRHIAEVLQSSSSSFSSSSSSSPSSSNRYVAPAEPPTKPLLFLFDEPTTGLHFDDVGLLLKVFQRLVDAGNSVLVIEHNLDVIKSADWLIDLGPGAGDEGGQLVAQGTPEDVARCVESHTGSALCEVLSGTLQAGENSAPPQPQSPDDKRIQPWQKSAEPQTRPQSCSRNV